MSKFESDPSNTGNSLPVESNDDAALRMLGGATFGPNARVILPSGVELSGQEAQVFTSAFAEAGRPETSEETRRVERPAPDDTTTGEDPLSSRQDVWTGNPKDDRASLVARAFRAIFREKQ